MREVRGWRRLRFRLGTRGEDGIRIGCELRYVFSGLLFGVLVKVWCIADSCFSLLGLYTRSLYFFFVQRYILLSPRWMVLSFVKNMYKIVSQFIQLLSLSMESQIFVKLS